MKIVLVSIASNSEAMNVPPLGVLYIGGALKKAGYEVKIKHVNPNKLSEYATKIVNENPLFVGFSTFTGTQLKYSAMLAKQIKKLSDVPLVYGGIHPSLKPEQSISEKYNDYVIVGEGEETAVELANALKNKISLKNVKGLVFKKDGKIIFNEERPLIKNLDNYPIDWSLIDVNKYVYPAWQNSCKRLISITGSRGCPHQCSFCYNIKFNKGLWRKQSAEFVINEIENLKKNYHIDAVNFSDDNFFANKGWALQIVEKINIPWKAEIRLDYITDELMQRLAKTKCKELMIGLESGSDNTLNIINKGYNVEFMKEKLNILARYPQITICGSLILGVPGETKEDIKKTIDFIVYLTEKHPKLVLTVGTYLPFPGSTLYNKALEYGFKEPERTENWDILDRWTNNMAMPWLPWADQKTLRNFVYVRKYSQMLAFKKIKPKLIYNFIIYRLRHQNFVLPIDIILFSWLRNKWMYPNAVLGSRSFFGGILRKATRSSQ